MTRVSVFGEPRDRAKLGDRGRVQCMIAALFFQLVTVLCSRPATREVRIAERLERRTKPGTRQTRRSGRSHGHRAAAVDFGVAIIDGAATAAGVFQVIDQCRAMLSHQNGRVPECNTWCAIRKRPRSTESDTPAAATAAKASKAVVRVMRRPLRLPRQDGRFPNPLTIPNLPSPSRTLISVSGAIVGDATR